MSDFEILALVKFNSGFALSINKDPEFIYTRYENILYGVCGPFVSVFYYEAPSGRFKAFDGAKFDLKLSDGSLMHCHGQWWDGGSSKAEIALNKKLTRVTARSIDSLRNCYVFTGYMADQEVLDKMLSEYKGETYGYWDYEKVIKYDSERMKAWNKISKLERDKKNLIKECKRLKLLTNKTT